MLKYIIPKQANPNAKVIYILLNSPNNVHVGGIRYIECGKGAADARRLQIERAGGRKLEFRLQRQTCASWGRLSGRGEQCKMSFLDHRDDRYAPI